jgi:hypothetical protein
LGSRCCSGSTTEGNDDDDEIDAEDNEAVEVVEQFGKSKPITDLKEVGGIDVSNID